jgi:hypothetical protein
MTRDEKLSIALVGFTLCAAVSAQRAAKGVGTARPEAAAFYGAMQLYRNLAIYFGKRALLAEAAYWRAVV